ncbi:MAG: hypothetical protein GX643_00040, partial [Acidimicrobiales bacterium]|nr:hypothetical protein [Acidimicrobiales bacterium]
MSDHESGGEPSVPEVPEPPATAATAAGSAERSQTRRRLRIASLTGVAVALAAVGAFAYKQIKPVVDAQRYATVTYEVPVAPQLTAASGETLLRIDPTRSSLTYEIEETFAGAKRSTATGSTAGIAGDLALNTARLEDSRVGQIVVNIEQFESDNNLRDARIRQDFLQSHRYPLATFDFEEIEGLSGQLEEGETYEFQMLGHVTVKERPAASTWDVTASYDDGVLTATATATAKLSRFDAGPISIAGLVQTEDEVLLTLELTAVEPSANDIATTVERAGRLEAGSQEAPSYEQVIEPILEQHCASCHNSGQFGAHTLTLDDAGDVQAVSDGLKTVTQTGYMPPWFASDEGVELAHKPTISDEEIAALAAWSDAGGPLDVDPETPLDPTKEAAELLPRQDQELRIEPYTGSL